MVSHLAPLPTASAMGLPTETKWRDVLCTCVFWSTLGVGLQGHQRKTYRCFGGFFETLHASHSIGEESWEHTYGRI